MMRLGIALSVMTLLTGAACMTAASDPSDLSARSMRVVELPPGDQVSVVAAKSLPPQFSLVVERSMPTPGWSFTVDEVGVDPERAAIVVRVTENAPAGMTAQVITPTRLAIPLGVVDRGRYFLELWSRRGADEAYRPDRAWVLAAH